MGGRAAPVPGSSDRQGGGRKSSIIRKYWTTFRATKRLVVSQSHIDSRRSVEHLKYAILHRSISNQKPLSGNRRCSWASGVLQAGSCCVCEIGWLIAFRTLDAVPSLQMLLIDTDGKSLMEVSHRQGGFKSHELLGVPLRRPQDYRTDSRDLLQWLSRRWLYNIPRSLKTEGLRPLGRLALVDHAEQIIDRMRTAIETATSEESLAQSQEQAGWSSLLSVCVSLSSHRRWHGKWHGRGSRLPGSPSAGPVGLSRR